MSRERAAPPRAVVVKPRIRVMRGTEIVLGPGKADLLGAVHTTGSLRKAAGALGMSYMRAWTLLKTMNTAFRLPLVTLARGGAGHGGAALTVTGRKVLAFYRSMESRCSRATAGNERELKKFLRK